MLILLFIDCQGFFLRHTASGKCITRSEELVYDDADYALPYFVVMTDNCLDVRAQFLYLNNTELLHDVQKGGTLISDPRTKDYKGRWAVYKGVTDRAKMTQTNTKYNLKQTGYGSLTQDNICAEPETKYVRRRNYCGGINQQFTFGK